MTCYDNIAVTSGFGNQSIVDLEGEGESDKNDCEFPFLRIVELFECSQHPHKNLQCSMSPTLKDLTVVDTGNPTVDNSRITDDKTNGLKAKNSFQKWLRILILLKIPMNSQTLLPVSYLSALLQRLTNRKHEAGSENSLEL